MHAEISTDKRRIDIDWVVRQIQGSYWGAHLAPTAIANAASRSLCFGAYEDGKQVGFARVVTDGSLFSSLTDLIVQEDRRGNGIGHAIMDAVVKHEDVNHTYCILRARPGAWFFYFKHDFRVFDRKSGLMHRQPQ